MNNSPLTLHIIVGIVGGAIGGAVVGIVQGLKKLPEKPASKQSPASKNVTEPFPPFESLYNTTLDSGFFTVDGNNKITFPEGTIIRRPDGRVWWIPNGSIEEIK